MGTTWAPAGPARLGSIDAFANLYSYGVASAAPPWTVCCAAEVVCRTSEVLNIRILLLRRQHTDHQCPGSTST